MKTTTGSLITRGDNYYCFWRHNKKAFSRVLRDESGEAITNKRQAEVAKEKLMEMFSKKNQIESLMAIQNKIGNTQTQLDTLNAAQDAKLNPPLTLSQAWTAFAKSTERHDCGKATLREYEHKWTTFVEWMEREHPAKTTLRDVDKGTARAYMEHLNGNKRAPATINIHLLTLKYIFRVLKDNAKLTDEVWKGIKRKTVITQSRRDLTVDELRKVVGTATGELKVLFAIGVYTGLRLGDCCTLRWCEVDMSRNQIRRVPNKTARRKPKVIVIPIHPVLHEILAGISADGRAEFVSPKTAKIYVNGSRPIITRHIQKHFNKCGIKTTKPSENGGRAIVEVGFHSLRHTFVSMCREANAPLSVVENLVGHSSVDMTRHYSHSSEQAATSAVALLPSINGNAIETTKPTKHTRDELLRELIESMTAKNLREKKAAALALLASATAN
jgi:integrase